MKAGAERHQANQLALAQPAVAAHLVEQDRNRGGRSVAEAIDVARKPFDGKLQLVGHGFVDALVGLVRAEFLRGRNFDYVRAARALGMLDVRIMFRHILPNAMTASLTFLPFILAGSVTTLTSLDFLGFGLPVGSPSLGELLLQGKNNLNAPWLAFTGFFIIALMLSLLVFIGEAVRDAFNPRKVLA